jgi:hypothetical protein
MTNRSLSIETAKFATVTPKGGDRYDLEFLDENMEFVNLKEYSTREEAEVALAYWTGPNKTITAA